MDIKFYETMLAMPKFLPGLLYSVLSTVRKDFAINFSIYIKAPVAKHSRT